MKALYSAMRREEKAIVPTAREEEAIERKMEGGATRRFIASLPSHLSELFSDYKEGSGRHSLHGSGPIPQLSILQQIAKAAYSTSPPPQIGPFKLIGSTPTLKFYGLVHPSNHRDIDTIVVGIRGTKTSDKQDLWADAQLALGRLEGTPRWTKDLADFKSFIGRQEDPDGMDIYGVGHSLGGAILDMFLKKNLIQQGVSYNPAIQLGDAQKDLNNRRIYQDGDPLLAIMGRSAKNVEVRPKKPSDESLVSKAARYVIPFYGYYKAAKGTLDAHALDNFIGGTHRKNVIKKLGLQDEGHSLAELAKASGIPRKTLQEVYNRGIGAYSTQPSSVRMKGTFKKGVDAPMSQKLSKEQWAMARVYSFIDGNPKHDTDLRGGGPAQSRQQQIRHWLDTALARELEPVEVPEDEQDIMTKQEFKKGDKVVYRISGTSKNGTFINVNTLLEDYPNITFEQFLRNVAEGSPNSVWRVGTVVIIPKGEPKRRTTPLAPAPPPVIRPTDMSLASPPPAPPPPPPPASTSPPGGPPPVRPPPRVNTGSPPAGSGRGKKVCMPKTEYLAEHEQLTDVLARPTPAKLRKELAKQTAEVKMRGGADEDPVEAPYDRRTHRVSKRAAKQHPAVKRIRAERKKPILNDTRYTRPVPKPRVISPLVPKPPTEEELDPLGVVRHLNLGFPLGLGSGYLRQARANAKAYGLDPKKLKLGDGKHKFSYDGIGFGLKSYKDFLLWSDEEKAGRVPKGTAEKKRKAYLARATKIKGDWKDNKISPNNLAIHILWKA
jgi:hypothetical protein